MRVIRYRHNDPSARTQRSYQSAEHRDGVIEVVKNVQAGNDVEAIDAQINSEVQPLDITDDHAITPIGRFFGQVRVYLDAHDGATPIDELTREFSTLATNIQHSAR